MCLGFVEVRFELSAQATLKVPPAMGGETLKLQMALLIKLLKFLLIGKGSLQVLLRFYEHIL